MKNNVKANILLTFAALLLLGVVVSGVLAIIGIIPKDRAWIPFTVFIGGDVVLIGTMLKVIDDIDDDDQDDE